jgi:hypothetical protein
MREELKHFNSKQITLEDGSQFYYTIQPFVMKNILGASIAVLDEYIFIRKGTAETYKLYRTDEGNWYDVKHENSAENNEVLRSLKLAFDNFETQSLEN